jgi:DNA-binding PadR family transcriptional regulator
MRDPADREIRLALRKLHILHHAARGPVYGLWLLDELAQHGHRLSPGTLYPILARMQRNGWLRSSPGGRAKARRDYRITAEGRAVLERLREDVDQLHRELVLGIEPRHGKGRPGSLPPPARRPRASPRRGRMP